MKGFRIIVVCIFFACLAACSPRPHPQPIHTAASTAPTLSPSPTAAPPTATLAPAPTATPVPTPTPRAPLGPPRHHVGVRLVDGVGEFYLRRTGEKFVPRGMNYVRLAPQTRLNGASTLGHALFDPGKYDAFRVGRDLQKLHANGYNVIRVFLSPDTLGTADGGLSPAYMQNVANLLTQAQQNQIYVMFTLDWLPVGVYNRILSKDCCSVFAMMNLNYLAPGGLQANQAFYRDFIGALRDLHAPTGNIFSYQLRNEMFYNTDQPPLSLNAGLVKTANGKSYDMSVPADKARMLDENLVYWIDAMRAAILEVDPTALVSVGFFWPQQPNPARLGDPRLALTAPAIWRSTADFIDLHAFSGLELGLGQYVQNFGMAGMQAKPVIMGEFGSASDRYPSPRQAAQVFVDWQVKSCQFGFDGWLFWTWDTNEQPEFFNASMGDGVIAAALAPAFRPDPCSP